MGNRRSVNKRWGLMVVLVLAFTGGAAGCSGAQAQGKDSGKEENLYKGKIIEAKENYVLLADEGGEGGGLVTVSSKDVPVKDSSGKETDTSSLKNGMILHVVLDEDGTIAESYPGQIHGEKEIRITEQGDDVTGLYLEAMKEIYQTDPGLNEGIKYMALDLSEVQNMSEAEKGALAYQWDGWLRSQSIEAEVYQKTYDELVEEGLIDAEKLYFPEGMLITIEDTEKKGDSFTFSISKWCSGLGADGLDDCKATFQNGVGTYSKGTAWIS